jgi:hypothetical protein
MDIVFDKSKVIKVPIDSVRPNSWNPKQERGSGYERVKRVLEIMGQQEPIRVRENDGYEIIDGEQRWTALKELGKTEIEIYSEGVVSDDEAKSMTINWEQHVNIDKLMLTDLIVNGIEDKTMLPFSSEELEAMAMSLKFEWKGSSDVESGNVVEEIRLIGYKFSLEQYDEICRGIKMMKSREDVDDSEALRLCVRIAIEEMERDNG